MALRDDLLAEFDQVMASSRKHLERAPFDKWDWKPHEKSMALGSLALHLAENPAWAVMAIKQDSFDVEPGGAPHTPPPPPASREELLKKFDENVAAAREAIAGAADELLRQNWTLLKNGQPLMTLPKLSVLRLWVLNHTIHHRAQLGLYLRLLDVPVPATYGPSADEQSS